MARYNNIFLRFVDKDGIAHFPDCTQPTVSEARKEAKSYATDPEYFDQWAESEGAHEKVATIRIINRGRGDSDTTPEELIAEIETSYNGTLPGTRAEWAAVTDLLMRDEIGKTDKIRVSDIARVLILIAAEHAAISTYLGSLTPTEFEDYLVNEVFA